MDLLPHCGAFCATAAILRCVAAHAHKCEKLGLREDRYDLRQLHYPLASKWASEKRAGFHIYDSVELNKRHATLDQNFERIQNIMFSRINHLATTGSAPAELEDDGCG